MFSGLNLRMAASAPMRSQGQYSVLTKINTMAARVAMNIGVCRSGFDISLGPIIEWRRRSPGRPGTGRSRVQPTSDRPIPAKAERCGHWSRNHKSSPSHSSERIVTRELFWKAIGISLRLGGSEGVKLSPITVRIVPHRNNINGAINSIRPRDFRSGIGVRSALR